VLSISEVAGIEGDVVLVQDLFAFRLEGVDSAGHAYGRFETCGVRPRALARMEAEGVRLPHETWRNGETT